MAKLREGGADRFRTERRKIQASGILDALIEYAEGKRDMSSSQVSAALGLLKKALPDLSSLALPDVVKPHDEGSTAPSDTVIEIRFVDPPR
jgi:hypothetical protein